MFSRRQIARIPSARATTLIDQRFDMTRYIRIRESGSGLDARVLLLDDLAPRSAEALWQIAGAGGLHEAIHAMWTGPEISCPIPAANLPPQIDLGNLPLENATSFPEEGDIAVVYAPANTWKGQPPFGFLDVGLFYGRGARLLMPMGWVQASVCGRVVGEDLAAVRSACTSIRRAGVCRLDVRQDS
jgi:Protein of unknown function (DUF3830)